MQLFALYIYENEQPMSVRKSNVTLPWDIYQWRHYPDALPAYKTKANSTQTQMFSLGSLEGLQSSGVWMTQMTCKMTASLRSTTNVPARVLKGLFWHFEKNAWKIRTFNKHKKFNKGYYISILLECIKSRTCNPKNGLTILHNNKLGFNEKTLATKEKTF